MEAVREYCQRKPVMLEKKMKHLQRDQVYRQQLVSNSQEPWKHEVLYLKES